MSEYFKCEKIEGQTNEIKNLSEPVVNERNEEYQNLYKMDKSSSFNSKNILSPPKVILTTNFANQEISNQPNLSNIQNDSEQVVPLINSSTLPGILMAIIFRTHPKAELTSTQSKRIRRKIRTEPIFRPATENTSRLLSVHYKGILWTICANMYIKTKLNDFLPTLNKFWDWADLILVNACDLPIWNNESNKILSLLWGLEASIRRNTRFSLHLTLLKKNEISSDEKCNLQIEKTCQSNEPYKKMFNSLEELEEMSSIEIVKIWLPLDDMVRFQMLLNNGFDLITAKKLILKDIYSRSLLDSGQISNYEPLDCSVKFPEFKEVPDNGKSICNDLKRPDENSEINVPKKKKKKVSKCNAKRKTTDMGLSEEPLNKFKLAVTAIGYPKILLDYNKLIELKNSINKVFENKLPGTSQLRFNDCQLRVGFILIEPADIHSALWLKDIVPKLELSEDVKLQTLIMCRPPKPLNYFTIIQNENNESLTLHQLLYRLKIGNQNLQPDLWILIRTEDKTDSTVFYFEVDKQSHDELVNLDLKPFFGLGRIEFKSFIC